MSDKTIIMGGMTVGSLAGSYLPTLMGADWLSWWSIIGSAVGGLLGIWVAYKILHS